MSARAVSCAASCPAENLVAAAWPTPPQLHGPYYQWTYKVKGKTRTVRLTEEQARFFEKSVTNHRQLRRIIRKREQYSLKKTDKILGAISHS